ncbi:phosphate-starvation-inducible PsiE family protein [Sulfurihydrogenibium sp.]|uniref:phosphate-starvation-inducible PsiE family protein n=1 Tax=Sulfurihydrogenibium sp. TaxID=2053621 RepID=UPI00262B4DEA|nr:phosphate-starvation-inducible PsiE family protein [Sulfurihydrogenibium sp.]
MKKRIIRIKNKVVEKLSNIDNTLIGFLENFDRLIHLFLAVLIVIVSLAIFAWFVHDFIGLVKNIIEFKKNISGSALRLFGTAILLWPLSSLLKAEINLIKGERISLNLFIDTAIAGTIRSVLISTAEGEELKETYYYIVALFVFALVRLIVVYTERLEKSSGEKGNGD